MFVVALAGPDALRTVGAMVRLLAAVLIVASPPVPGPVLAGFQPPASLYGPGHRGLDYAVAPGEPARAVTDGVVTFAGTVGATRHVSVRLVDGRVVTLSFLQTVAVQRGETVRRGQVVGTAGGVDPLDPRYDGSRLLLTLRVGGQYVDPSGLFAPPDLAKVVHLAPWRDEPPPAPPVAPVAPVPGSLRLLALATLLAP